MRVRVLVLTVFALLLAGPGAAQTTDPVAGLLLRMEDALLRSDGAAFRALITPDADLAQIDDVVSDVTRSGLVRVVIRERDRQPLNNGAGLRLVVDIFSETSAQARVTTWRLDLDEPSAEAIEAARAPDGPPALYRINGLARLSVLDSLFRLTLSSRQYSVEDLTIQGEDLRVHVERGSAWMAEVNGLPTALVVFGAIEMTFAPAPASEQGQLRLFAGSEVLRTRASRVFLRLNPSDRDVRFNAEALQPAALDRVAFSRAQSFFADYVARSFSLDLQDLSDDTWSLVPGLGDMLIDVDTARLGVLTYARSGNDFEDISLFDRRRRKNISVYSSARQLAIRGSRHYDEADQLDYAVEHYNVDVSYDPARTWMEGRADLDIVIRSASATSLMLRLAEPLTVRAVTADQFGRLLALRVREQNNVIVNLPDALRRGDRLRLRVAYGGRLPPHLPEREALTPGAQPLFDMPMQPEPRFTYSNHSWWYPQPAVSTFATARVRIVVPDGYVCVATGVPQEPEAFEGADGKTRQAFVFQALQPLRYLAFVVSRLQLAESTSVAAPYAGTLAVSDVTRRSRLGGGVFYDAVDVEIWTQPRAVSRGRALLEPVSDILGFYQQLMDDVPYPVFRLVAVEDVVPGGHSPAYFALLHQPLPATPFSWARDPVAFDDFPHFFLAHEVAHQYWGQAVGWENYHEQWISEGFAQYLAALYAEHSRPRDVFTGVLRQMNRSSIAASDQGPVWLGYRLGHLKSDGRVFRSIVYNKGAMVLHMLRRMVGDEVFRHGLQRFYGEARFRRVGTADLRAAFEQESGQPLERFFDRWIFESGIPTLRATWEIGAAMDTSAGADGQAPSGPVLQVRVEQDAPLYDIPLSVTILYTDGSTDQVLLIVDDEVSTLSMPVTRPVRDVRFNEDHGALVRMERARR
jgi:hypothetical protein